MERYEQRGQVVVNPPAGVPRLHSAGQMVILLLVCRDCGGLVVDDLQHDRWHDHAGGVRAAG
jgi:hypothetical protein